MRKSAMISWLPSWLNEGNVVLSFSFETTAQNVGSHVIWANYNHSPQHIWNDFLHSGYKGQRCIVFESAYSNSDDEQWDVLQSPRPPSSLLISLLPCSLPIEATMFMVIISPSQRSQRAPWCSWRLTVRGQKNLQAPRGQHTNRNGTPAQYCLGFLHFCFCFYFVISPYCESIFLSNSE